MQNKDFGKSNTHPYENTVKLAQDSLFASAAEFASIALRSPETSIILAEAASRNREPRKRTRIVEIVWRSLSILFDCTTCSEAVPDISMVFTPNGPLVYQWQRTKFDPPSNYSVLSRNSKS